MYNDHYDDNIGGTMTMITMFGRFSLADFFLPIDADVFPYQSSALILLMTMILMMILLMAMTMMMMMMMTTYPLMLMYSSPIQWDIF